MYLTLYDLDRLAATASGGSGVQPYAPWLFRARATGTSIRRSRRRRARAVRPPLAARPATGAGR